jgi:nucleoside diphosphate kinase
MVGSTDPSKASKEPIRGKYFRGDKPDSFDFADSEKRNVFNIIHASRSKEDFKRELDIVNRKLLK